MHELCYSTRCCAHARLELFALIKSEFFSKITASKNATDWWLSYWVAHIEETLTTNTTAPIAAFYSERLVLKRKEKQSLVCRFTSALLLQSSKQSVEKDNNTYFYLYIYAGLGALNSLLTLIRAFTFAYGGLHAAKKSHESLLQSVLKVRT